MLCHPFHGASKGIDVPDAYRQPARVWRKTEDEKTCVGIDLEGIEIDGLSAAHSLQNVADDLCCFEISNGAGRLASARRVAGSAKIKQLREQILLALAIFSFGPEDDRRVAVQLKSLPWICQHVI